MFLNDLPNAITDSGMLLFADNSKCFRLIRLSHDEQLLQHDLDRLLCCSSTSNFSTVCGQSGPVSSSSDMQMPVVICHNLKCNSTMHS